MADAGLSLEQEPPALDRVLDRGPGRGVRLVVRGVDAGGQRRQNLRYAVSLDVMKNLAGRRGFRLRGWSIRSTMLLLLSLVWRCVGASRRSPSSPSSGAIVEALLRAGALAPRHLGQHGARARGELPPSLKNGQPSPRSAKR
jgi:hypothetical protein